MYMTVRAQADTPVSGHVDSVKESTVLPAAINTAYPENNPVLSADGRTLYFSRQGHPLNYGMQNKIDIWVSTRFPKGDWNRAINAGAPLNTRGDNRVAGIVAGGNRIYLINSGEDHPSEHNGLYYAERHGRSWSTPAPVLIDSLQPGERPLHFYPAIDEQTLLLSLERPGGFGRRDLYVVFRKPEGGWSAPQNLGPLINTSGDERRMVLAADGKTLYFSSDGRPGQGGTDLFMSRRLDESWRRWSAPVSLGDAVNSRGDDDQFSVSADGGSLLLARPSLAGDFDLFEFNLPGTQRPAPVTIVRGKVPENDTVPTVYTRYSSGGGDISAGRITPRPDGVFRLVLPGNQGRISLFMKDDEHFAPSRCISLGGGPPEALDTPNTPVLSILSQHTDYLQREDAVKDLANQIRETRKQQLFFLKKVRAYREWIPVLPFDTSLLSRDTFKVIAEKFRIPPNGKGGAGAYQGRKGGPGIEPDRPDSSADRLKKLRQRYHQYQDAETSTSTDIPPSSFYSAKTFEDYCREVWLETLKKEVPLVKRSLDSTLVEERLHSRRSSSQPDLLQIRFLEEQQQRFSESLPESDNILLPLDDWEGQLKNEIEAVLRREVSEKLRELLKEPAREALDNLLRQYHKGVHLANLERSLQALLQRQMALEQSVKAPQASSKDTLAHTSSRYREIESELSWIPLEEGQVWPLRSVLFEANSSRLLPLSFAELERVARLLKKHPAFEVEVAAHTHGELSHRQAQQLSAARADAVARTLIGLGLGNDSVRSRGYGRCFPVANNDTLSGRQQNQRVELLLSRKEKL